MEDRNIKFPHREIYLSLQIKEVHEKNKKQIIIKKLTSGHILIKISDFKD